MISVVQKQAGPSVDIDVVGRIDEFYMVVKKPVCYKEAIQLNLHFNLIRSYDIYYIFFFFI